MKPLIVIVGPTASGKTGLAIELAQQLNGEIICADSRTIYRGIDIGTAKPTLEEQARIPHYLIDLIEPTESFSAAKFKQLANEKIAEIHRRGTLPIIAGGTGLYIDSVLFDFQFQVVADPGERERLSAMSVDELQSEVVLKGLPMPVNKSNPRHLARVIETSGQITTRSELRQNTLVFGLDPGLDELKQRIHDRVDVMVDTGLIDEIKQLASKYGWEVPGMLTPACKAYRGFFENRISLDEAKVLHVRNEYLLARRQRTWFKHNKSIRWNINREEIVELATTLLNKKQW